MSADIIETYDYPRNDEMARDNRYILDLEDASLGRTSMLGFPIFMSETPGESQLEPPRDSASTPPRCCSDVLGYTPATNRRAHGRQSDRLRDRP